MLLLKSNKYNRLSDLRIFAFRLGWLAQLKPISQRHKISLKPFNAAKSQVRNELDSFYLYNILLLVVDLRNDRIFIVYRYVFLLCLLGGCRKAKIKIRR